MRKISRKFRKSKPDPFLFKLIIRLKKNIYLFLLWGKKIFEFFFFKKKKILRKEQKNTFNAHEKYLLEKVCELCSLIKNDNLLLLCDYCDDAYHTYCLSPPLIELPPEDEPWVCKVCIDDRK